MTADPSARLAARDAALRAVGRTIVNFRRLEHHLKILSPLGPVEGTPASINRQIEARVKQAADYTLGQAIGEWIQALDGVPAKRMPTNDLFDPTVRLEFGPELDAAGKEAHASALRALLAARNELVHGRQTLIDWDSIEACERLADDLRGLNDDIARALRFVEGLTGWLRDLHNDLQGASTAIDAAVLMLDGPEPPAPGQSPSRAT
jgi:hypothetical protein